MTSLGGISFGREITLAAARHGLDARLLAAVAAQETGGPGSDSGRNIVGDGGHGHGVFQIDDRWHDFAATPAAADPAANADYAAGMLSGLLRRFGGDVREALSAYNAGSPDAQGTVTTWPDGSRLGYADSVLRHLSRLGGMLAGGDAKAVAVAAALPASETQPLESQALGVASPAARQPIGGIDFAPSDALRRASLTQPLQTASQQPPLQAFRSFSSELQAAGSAIEDADRRMAALIDPSEG